jgi:TetR/AcrR family transcriptional repressor of nem operon
MVGRPREFDPDQVLNSAMHAFWAKGYEATSLNDLMSATGLHKGSLYQAFGDKHSLFIRALNLYLEDMRRQKNEILNRAKTPLSGLREAVHAMVELADDSPCPKGCMVINALTELAPHDPEVKEILMTHLQGMRSSITNAIELAQKAGEVGSDKSPQVLSALITTFMAGIATTLKGPLNKTQAHELLDAHLEALF